MSNPIRDAALSKTEDVARGVRIVARLLGCADGQKADELADHFEWPLEIVMALLDRLVQQGLVDQFGPRFQAAPTATTRTAEAQPPFRSRVRR